MPQLPHPMLSRRRGSVVPCLQHPCLIGLGKCCATVGTPHAQSEEGKCCATPRAKSEEGKCSATVGTPHAQSKEGKCCATVGTPHAQSEEGKCCATGGTPHTPCSVGRGEVLCHSSTPRAQSEEGKCCATVPHPVLSRKRSAVPVCHTTECEHQENFRNISCLVLHN